MRYGFASLIMKPGHKYQKEVLWLERNDSSGHIYFPGSVQVRRAEVLELVGRWDLAEEIWRRRLEHARAGGVAEETIQAILTLVKLLQRRGRYDEAGELVQESLGLSERVGDRKFLGQSLAGLGVVNWRRGDHGRAKEFLERALALYREINFTEGTSAVLNNLGVILEGRGLYDQALKCYQEKRAIDEKLGNRRGIANLLNNMGVCMVHQSELGKAEEMFLEKLEIDRTMGNKAGVATALSNLGIVYRNRGEYQKALECCHRTIEICDEVGDLRGKGITTNNMGNIYKEQGQPLKAMECYQSALAVAQAQGDRKDIAIYSGNIAQIYHFWLEKPAKALENYERAVSILTELDQPYHLCEYLLYRCQLLMDWGQEQSLELDLQRIGQAAERSGREEIAIRARILHARLEAGQDTKTATAALEELAVQATDQENIAEALFWLSRISGDPGHKEQALLAIEAFGNTYDNPEIRRWLGQLRKDTGKPPEHETQGT